MKKIIFIIIAVFYSSLAFSNGNASNIVGFQISKYIKNETNHCFSFYLPIGNELKPEGCNGGLNTAEKEWIDQVEILFNSKSIKIIFPDNINSIVIPFKVTHAHLKSGGQHCAFIDYYDDLSRPKVQFRQCNNFAT